MDAGRLFQLGTDLDHLPVGSGATQTEGETTKRARTAPARAETRVVDPIEIDETRPDHFVRRGDKVFAGTHLIIEVIDGDGLDDADRIETAFRECVTACGATLLHIHLHKFSPQGVSGVAVLAESHISVHTWPERRYGAFDVFMCGDAVPHRAVDVLQRAFDAGDVRVTELLRGEGIV